MLEDNLFSNTFKIIKKKNSLKGILKINCNNKKIFIERKIKVVDKKKIQIWNLSPLWKQHCWKISKFFSFNNFFLNTVLRIMLKIFPICITSKENF